MLGYGSQGRALALNLRDSAYEVVIGLPAKSSARRTARRDGFTRVHSAGAAVKMADCLCFALPDHLHGRVFAREIRPHLRQGSTLVFLHGFSVHFGFVKPPPDCDVIMVAPHAPGVLVREQYLTARTLSAFYAVEQDRSGRAERKAVALARAMGFRKSRLVKTSFEHEAIGDLFGEQAVLCGGLSELIVSGFRLLVEKGVPPENAYLEVAYQLDLIIRLIKQYGIEGMYKRISVTARYGSTTSGRKVIGNETRKKMAAVYRDIESGKFARKLNSLTDKDIRSLNKLIKKLADPAFDRAARKYAK
ncbi:MAG: ketol-acid reductoisomerase [Candidatus Zixiibacteriota bacterium]|nr:MAG: ketol-acid reductoisomerase [candidate division Zixibacteria bacterium]